MGLVQYTISCPWERKRDGETEDERKALKVEIGDKGEGRGVQDGRKGHKARDRGDI